MKVHRTGFMSAALALAVHLGTASESVADDAIVLERPFDPALPSDGTWADRPLVLSGPFTLDKAYVPPQWVAIESDGRADDNLNTPVASSWLNLPQRDADCDRECGFETKNQSLRIADGIFQGLGPLQVLGSLVLPQRQVLTIASGDGAPTLSFSVMPTKITRGSGFVAMAKF